MEIPFGIQYLLIHVNFRTTVYYIKDTDKIFDMNELSQTAYSLTTETQEIIFALTSMGKYITCGYTLIRIEHPKFIIFETTPWSNNF